MNSYENEIMKLLVGETPKQKYDFLLTLIKSEKDYNFIKGQVIWAVTHYKVVATKGIMDHLSDVVNGKFN